jgi:enoyl-CoA hydratase/carnithine racemase
MHTDFFRDEYIMNYMLAESLAPQVSIWDGFVMGGGVGISIFGEFRVATEKAVFAMPETAIGLFPDVGGSSWLPHLKDGVGAYVGMTGCRLNAADLVYANMATHFITR